MQTHLIDTISSNCGPSPTGLAYCGARSFTITNDSSSSSDTTLFQGSYDSATGVLTITVQATQRSQVGTNQFSITATLDQYSGQTFTHTQAYPVTVTDPCTSSVLDSITYTALTNDISNISYPTPGTASLTMAEPNDSVSSAKYLEDSSVVQFCGARVITVTDTSTGTVIDTTVSTSVVSYSSNVLTFTPTQAGTSTYKVQFGLQDFTSIAKVETTLTVTATSLTCDTTAFADISVTSTDFDVQLPSPGFTTIALVEPTDTLSLSQGSNDGYTYCGSRTLTATNTATSEVLSVTDSTAPFSYSNSVLTFTPTTAGTYSYSLQFTLDSYSSVTSNAVEVYFSVSDGCTATEISAVSLSQDYIELLIPQDTQIQLSLQEPSLSPLLDCGALSLQVRVNSVYEQAPTSEVWYSAGQLTLQPPSSAGSYQYELAFGLDNYSSVGVSELQIEVLVREPCLTTTFTTTYSLDSSQIEVAIGETKQLKISPYPILDTASLNYGTSLDGITLCGSRMLKMSNSNQDFVTLTSASYQGISYTDGILSISPVSEAELDLQFYFTLAEFPQLESNRFSLHIVPLPATATPAPQANIGSFQQTEKHKALSFQIIKISVLGVVTVKCHNYGQLALKQKQKLFKADQLVEYWLQSTELLLDIESEADDKRQFTSSLLAAENLESYEDNESIFQFQIQLQFERPLLISTQGNDKLQLSVLPLVNKQDSQVKQLFFLESAIPRQIKNQQELEQLEKVSSTIKATSEFLLYIYIALNFVFSFAMGMLWSTFQMMQVATTMPRLLVQVPQNVVQILNSFTDIVNLKLIDSATVYDVIIEEHQSGRRLQSEPNEIDKTAIIGDVLLFTIGITVLLSVISCLVLFIRYGLRKCHIKIKRFVIKTKGKLMWNSLLRYITQSYLLDAISCLMLVKNMKQLSRLPKFLTSVQLILLVIAPLAIYILLRRKKKVLHTLETQASYGTLYLNLLTTKKSVTHFMSIYMYRRLAIAVVISFFGVSVVLQLYSLITLSMLQLSFLLTKMPFQNLQYNLLAIVNEAVLLVCVYLMFLFTDFVPQPELRYEFGQRFLTLLYANIACNFMIIGVEFGRILLRKARRYQRQRSLIRRKKQKILAHQQKQLVKVNKQPQQLVQQSLPQQQLLLVPPASQIEAQSLKVESVSALQQSVDESSDQLQASDLQGISRPQLNLSSVNSIHDWQSDQPKREEGEEEEEAVDLEKASKTFSDLNFLYSQQQQQVQVAEDAKSKTYSDVLFLSEKKEEESQIYPDFLLLSSAVEQQDQMNQTGEISGQASEKYFRREQFESKEKQDLGITFSKDDIKESKLVPRF